MPLTLDTIAFDLEAMCVSLVWRAQLPITHARAHEVRGITLGLIRGQ